MSTQVADYISTPYADAFVLEREAGWSRWRFHAGPPGRELNEVVLVAIPPETVLPHVVLAACRVRLLDEYRTATMGPFVIVVIPERPKDILWQMPESRAQEDPEAAFDILLSRVVLNEVIAARGLDGGPQ